MSGDGSSGTGTCERGRKAARVRRARPGAPEGRSADGGGICGRCDADRKGGGSGCELSGILPTDRMAGGEGEYI